MNDALAQHDIELLESLISDLTLWPTGQDFLLDRIRKRIQERSSSDPTKEEV